MKWQGQRRSSNVQDRRGQPTRRTSSRRPRRGPRVRIPSGGGRSSIGGFGSIGMIVVVLLISWALGINPLSLLSGTDILPQTNYQPERSRPVAQAGNDELGQFVGTVLGSTEDVWGAIFSNAGERYPAPVLVLFSGRTQSGCGAASAATGPFYCPADRQIYLDLAFYNQLRRQFGAPGDFAQAYVLAHEVGHHVQNLTGVLPEFNRARQKMSKVEANAMSVRVELQADCYAGIWAKAVGQQNLLERGDIEEALNAATQIGDDTLQQKGQGYVVPKTFNHGTSAQRKRWFKRGYADGNPQACDTFNARRL